MNVNLFEALRAHVRVRRTESAEVDDLLGEVQKWGNGADRAVLTRELLALMPNSGRPQDGGAR